MADTENEKPLCSCGNAPAREPHTCPYQEEINGNDNPNYCTCCTECIAVCMDEI